MGLSQSELADSLDVKSLFNQDLQPLSPQEVACLKAIAKSSPADWYEILDTFTDEVVRALLNRRLVVKSGDRLNLYWDIFRDYVLTNQPPSLPFTYLPSSPSIRAMLTLATRLRHNEDITLAQVIEGTNIREGTAQNIAHDLRMFGVAAGTPNVLRLDGLVHSAAPVHILQRIRDVLKRHALTRMLARADRRQSIRPEDLIESLKAINRAAQHNSRTWQLYSERMCRWLEATGILVATPDGLAYGDRGVVIVPGQT